MKIALATGNHAVGATPDTWGGGGVTTIVRWLRDGLRDAGHEVDIHRLASAAKDSLSRRVLSPRSWGMGIEPRRAAEDAGSFYWGANWVEFESQRYRPRRELTAVLNEYDLIQVVAGGPALALAVSAAYPPKALQVATTLLMERRAHLPDMPPAKRILKTLSLPRLHRMEVRALRAMDHVFVENRWMESWVREQGQPHVTLAPPGIDTEVFRPLGEWDPSRPIIAFGRLDDSRKDWPTAVAAYEQFVRSSGLANGLVLAGKGPLHPALRRALDVSPVRDRITIREDVPAAELPSLLASGSVFLQSSLEEGLGLAGLEAMACGLPVVSTATVGAAEYVRDGENGILADLGPSAAVELASGLARVMASSSGTQLSSAGLATVREGYSSAVALEGFVSVYAQLLQSGRGGIRRGVIQ